MQSDPEGLLDLCREFRPGARRFGAAQVLEQFASELERTPTAAGLVEQARHPSLLEPSGHQIVGGSRVAMGGSRRAHVDPVQDVGTKHFVLDLDLVDGKKEGVLAIE